MKFNFLEIKEKRIYLIIGNADKLFDEAKIGWNKQNYALFCLRFLNNYRRKNIYNSDKRKFAKYMNNENFDRFM